MILVVNCLKTLKKSFGLNSIMGKLVKKGKRHCIAHAKTGVLGRCFLDKSKAKLELKKAVCHAKQRAGKVKSCSFK
jgi:hypothetical protein